MRFRELDLLAWGPFTERRLVFDDAPRLQVVFGPNEAGKSTTLRALGGLLFGIPERTGDAHVHPMSRLRIGAVLEASTGERLTLVRRKGRKATLTDADGRPLADDELAPFLRGLTRERFLTTFALDHETLRSGAEALLAGRGSVGESLFDAGLGGPGVRRVLNELEDEAARIFAPKAQQRSLNAAVRAFREERQTLAQSTRSPVAWREQEQEIERLRSVRAELASRREALRTELNRLERELRVRPMLATLDQLARERAELGDVHSLPADVAARREDAARRLEGAERGRRPLADEVRRLETRQGELVVSPDLAQMPDAVADEIDDGLGRHRAAVTDLPKLVGKRAHALADVRRAREELGLSGDVELDVATLARVRVLADRHAELAADARHARAAASEAGEALERARARLAAVGEPLDATELAAGLEQLAREGELEERLRALADEHDRQGDELTRALARLGLGLSPGELLQRAWPEREDVEAAVAEERELVANERRLAAERRTLDARRRDVREELDGLRAAGAPPSEADLTAARDARDRALSAARPHAELAPLVRRADEVADRLRRDAGRVERLATLSVADERLAAEAAELEDRAGELAATRTELARRWAELWRGTAPPRVDRAQRFVASVARLLGDAERRAATGAELASLRERRDRWRLRLGRALAADAEPDADLSTLRARAVALVREAERRAEARRAGTAEVADAEAVLRRREERVAEVAAALERWRDEWRDAIAPLGRSADEDPRVVLELVGMYGELVRKVERAQELGRRIEGMERDSSAFERLVEERIARHAPELAELAERSLPDAAAELVRRQRDLRRVEAERADVAERLAERRAELGRHEEEIARARAELAELLQSAGAADLDELLALEERWRRASSIDEQRAAEERRILAVGDGASIAELARAVEALDADAQRSRQHEIEVELAELDDEIEETSRQLALSEAGLDHFRESAAPQSAEEAEAALAVVRAEARRYAQARLGAVLLAREIERYRQENQGPILARANEVFPRLTLGRYQGLRVAFDERDQPCLRCVRGAEEVAVTELSDGTRDQLYLALRVASIERHVAHDEPVPFVLDDCLVHFDDERARAALDVLSELAAETQVLLFTHHAGLVELARATPNGASVQSLHAAPDEAAAP